MILRESIHLVAIPIDASLVARIFVDHSSPKPWMASRLVGESSPRRKTPCAMLLRESKRESQTSFDSSCFSSGRKFLIIS